MDFVDIIRSASMVLTAGKGDRVQKPLKWRDDNPGGTPPFYESSPRVMAPASGR